jgi:hypothetical protein
MEIIISVIPQGKQFKVIANNGGNTETLFNNIIFLSDIAAATWVTMNFDNKFNCRRVAGKWILEV